MFAPNPIVNSTVDPTRPAGEVKPYARAGGFPMTGVAAYDTLSSR
jgi:hypothetical protein